jgi:hypothetical protein
MASPGYKFEDPALAQMYSEALVCTTRGCIREHNKVRRLVLHEAIPLEPDAEKQAELRQLLEILLDLEIEEFIRHQ